MGDIASTPLVNEPIALCGYVNRRKIQDTLQGQIYLLTTEGATKSSNVDTYLPPIIIKKTSKALVRKGISRANCRIAENYHEELRILTYLSSLKDVDNYGICCIINNYVWSDDNNYYYGMQYCDGGDLFEYLRKTLPSENNMITRIHRAQTYFKQMLRSVSYLHHNGIAHRDLSLENTMLDDKHGTHLKLIDFGVAFDIRKHNYSWISHQRVGKLNYMAPELLRNQNIEYDARAADIWSLGVCLFMMLCGYPLFENRNRSKYKLIFNLKRIDIVLRKRLNHLRVFDACVVDQVIDLLSKMFKWEKERIKMDDILSHPFVGLNDLEIINTYDEYPYCVDSNTYVAHHNRFIILNRVMFRQENNYF